MTFRKVMMVISTHLAWQVYGAVGMVREHTLVFIGLGLLIGFVTYVFYEIEFREESNDETKA